jgi:hypothetical protein
MGCDPEDGGSMDVRNFGTCYNTTRVHNPEDLDLNHCRRESIKTHVDSECIYESCDTGTLHS